MSHNKTNKILDLAENTENPEKLKLALKVCLQANDQLEQEVKELKIKQAKLLLRIGDMADKYENEEDWGFGKKSIKQGI